MMAGLFGDFFSGSPNPNGGTDYLGGLLHYDPSRATPGVNKLSLLGAMLKDMSTGGQTDSIDDVLKQAQMTQRNAVAQRLSDAFTQVNPVEVTPAMNDMSAQAPKLRSEAATLNAQTYAIPSKQDLAPLLAQGVANGLDPTPYLALQKAEAGSQMRILSPTEAQGMGFRPGSVIGIGDDGIPKVLQSSDVKSDQAVAQDIYLKQNDPGLAIQRASQAETARHNRVSESQPIAVAPGATLYDRRTGQPVFSAPMSPADQMKIAKNQDAQDKATRQAIEGSKNVISKVDAAIGQIDGWTTGAVGAGLRNIPQTGAFSLDKTIDTIKANVGFDRLQALRDASPTGGALGQVSEMENRLLQSTIASLDTGLPRAQLKQNLMDVKRHYQNILSLIQGRMPPKDQLGDRSIGPIRGEPSSGGNVIDFSQLPE